MRQFTHGSLFSGIGAMDLGFERAGFRTEFQVEISDFCRRILERHFPDTERFSDIRECDSLPSVDVLSGGFPCQPSSLAGRRKVQADERWLWPEYKRIVGLLRPQFIVVENVSGLLTGGFEEVISDLSKMRYDAEWQVISASSVGAPHVRERIWLVAYPESEQVLQLPEALIFTDSPSERSPRPWESPAPLHSEASPFREASGVVDAVRQGTLPYVCGRHDGTAGGMDRIKALGNAVVPQIAEWIAQRIKVVLEGREGDRQSLQRRQQ